MKNIKLVLAACTIATALMQTSCKEEFIELTPELQVAEDDIYNNAGRIETAMNGVYARMKSNYFLGGYVTCGMENRSDDVVNVADNAYVMADAYKHCMAAQSIPTGYLYQYGYIAINSANTMIENLETRENLPIDAATRDLYIQSNKFIRAISYFYLAQLYSIPFNVNPNAKAVPLRTKPCRTTADNDCPAATISEIYNQILADTENISALPQNAKGAANGTHASQDAAHMLRMRVYMSMNKWQEAINEGLKVTDYSLSKSVAEMFDTPYYSDETIFSVPFSSLDRGSSQYHPAGYFCHVAATVDTLNMRTGIASKPEFCLDTDARRDFYYTDAKGNIFYEKYNEVSMIVEWIHVFRYAETMLNLAECYINVGGADNEAKAADLTAQVRKRSIPSGDIIDVASMRGEELKEAIYNERRCEFLSEGMRGWDIARRGEDFYHPSDTPDANGKWFNVLVAATSDATSYTWAIPTYEVMVNTALGK